MFPSFFYIVSFCTRSINSSWQFSRGSRSLIKIRFWLGFFVKLKPHILHSDFDSSRFWLVWSQSNFSTKTPYLNWVVLSSNFVIWIAGEYINFVHRLHTTCISTLASLLWLTYKLIHSMQLSNNNIEAPNMKTVSNSILPVCCLCVRLCSKKSCLGKNMYGTTSVAQLLLKYRYKLSYYFLKLLGVKCWLFKTYLK